MVAGGRWTGRREQVRLAARKLIEVGASDVGRWPAGSGCRGCRRTCGGGRTSACGSGRRERPPSSFRYNWCTAAKSNSSMIILPGHCLACRPSSQAQPTFGTRQPLTRGAFAEADRPGRLLAPYRLPCVRYRVCWRRSRTVMSSAWLRRRRGARRGAGRRAGCPLTPARRGSWSP